MRGRSLLKCLQHLRIIFNLHRIRRHHQYAHSVRIDLGQPVAPPMCSDVSYNPLNQIDDHLLKELLCGHKKTTMMVQLPLNRHNLLRRLGADQREMATSLVGVFLQPHLQVGALAFQDRTLRRITLFQVKHQKRARQLALEQARMAQARQVKIHSGLGPDQHRGNKPLPFDHDTRLQMARQSMARQEAMDKQINSRQRMQSTPPSRRHLIGDPYSNRPEQYATDSENPSKWTQLRRKADQSQNTPPQDPYARARAEREQHAAKGIYTPLGNRNVPERSRYDAPRADMWSRPTFGQSAAADATQSNSRRGGNPNTFQSSAAADATQHNPHRGGNPNIFQPSRGFQIPESSAPPAWQPENNAPRWPGAFANGTVLGQVGGDLYKNTSQPPLVQWHAAQESEKNVKKDEAAKENEEDEVEAEPAPRRRKVSSRFAADEEEEVDSRKSGRKGKDKSKRRQRQDEDEDDEVIALAMERAELRKQRKRERAAKKAAAPTPMLLPEYISVSNLAAALKVKLDKFVEKMEELGFEETDHDYILNAENAGLIAQEYNFEPIIERGESEDLKARPPPNNPAKLPPRSPVVTIMGHVDHGKTTILDYLRNSSVAATEHGGITQHIGAFSVPMASGKIVTFLDTPGHEAFLSMRQRGANVTDIVILVVAADDSVMPQTIEAINHAKAAKVPMIVAINKVDREEANVERVKQDLARHGVEIEDYGGDTQVVCVSGKTGQGMDELEEAAVTLSEILDMRAEIDGPAEGWVIEASIKSMGKVATVLVRRGTMRPGDFIVAGKTWARIRCLRNEAGVEIEEAGPGTPVEIDGWRDQPAAGDEVLQAPDEAKAKSVIDFRLEKEERDKLAEDMEAINESRKAGQEKRERERLDKEAEEDGEEKMPALRDPTAGGPKPVYFIVKGDVSGSVEAVINSIQSIGTKEVEPVVLRSGVGQLSEFDVEHAETAKGCLINFNTPIEPRISRLAEDSGVTILDHNIIYRLGDAVRAELSKHLPPLRTRRVLGEAEIAQIFDINIKGRKYKPFAGCKIRNGTIAKGARYQVLRKGEKIFEGALDSLKHGKKDVTEMKKGTECGMGFEGWWDFKVGDQVQAYEEVVEKRYL
ncbi:mitochondrial translation initiation factor protein [Rutstroemia sp. NJR-2017a BBW]|nr:mitochondrial translation initiation factor protein [Rutstroemia sp. NJR-2017a BBW]